MVQITLLLIETSSPVCSVALSKNDVIIDLKEDNSGLNHAKLAPQFIQDLLKQYQPNAVVISAGPGSYTGLRIGVSLAKGICYGFNIPLCSVSSLKAMADGLLETNHFEPSTVVVPMLDAKRMEVYTAAYKHGKEIFPVQPMILNENSFKELAAEKKVFFGSGMPKAKPLLQHFSHACFVDGFELSAKYLLKQGLEKFKDKQFENIGYFEPSYLKNFVITPPKKKLF